MATVPELQAALQRAHDNEARYRLMLEHSGAVCWMVDCASLRLVYLSPAALEQFGYTLEQAQALAPMLLQDLPARLARFAAGDHSVRFLSSESEQPHRDGRLIPVEIDSTLVCNADGEVDSVVGVIRDMSSRQELLDQQKKFASMVSHEFRTPLATIDGAVQRLESTGAHHDEATRKRYRKIQNAVDRMLAMLEEYLSPERLASIGRQRQANEISPRALLEEAAGAARLRRPQISVHSEGLPQWLRADPNGMRLCLEILLDNAIKYTPEGSPIVMTGRLAPEGGVELLVRDQGPGLAPDEHERVFERGVRGAAAGAMPVAGSGLGLYMARSVLEVQGGSVSVRNLAESGAEFRIWLPMAMPAGKSLAPDGCSSDNSLT